MLYVLCCKKVMMMMMMMRVEGGTLKVSGIGLRPSVKAKKKPRRDSAACSLVPQIIVPPYPLLYLTVPSTNLGSTRHTRHLNVAIESM